jgi:Cu-processing system permease protein
VSDGGPDPGCQRETDGGTVAATGAGSDVHADTAVGSGRERSDRLSMLGAVRTVARREYRVAARNRREVGLSALFALFAVGIVGFAAARPDARHDVVASLVELGVYLVPLVALVVGYDAVVGPEESGTLDTLLALPVARGTVLVGTFLGRASVLCGAALVGLGLGGVAATVLLGSAGIAAYGGFVLVATATAAAFLAVGVLVSSIASEKTRALGVWVWFVLLHDLLAIGAVAALRPPGPAVAALALANPLDVFRLLALRGLDTISVGFAAAASGAGFSTPVLVAALAAWIALPVAAAARAMARRRV